MPLSNKKFKKITVITPVYNRENLLEITLKSILGQNYPNLEYIVIDDGSTDKSLDVIKKYHKKIKVISQKNQGETKTVNRGLRMASGDIIGVVNSDDPLLPLSLFKIAKFFEQNSKILVAYPDWKIINGKGKAVSKVTVPEHDYRNMFVSQYCYIGPGAFFTKKALNIAKVRSLDFRYVSDFEFWLRLGLSGEFKRIPQVLATFRIHEGSQSQYARGRKMAWENVELVRHIILLNNFPNKLKVDIPKALSSSYFLAGGKAVDLKFKLYFYTKSFLTSPIIFSKKVKYELVKLKHRFLV